MAQNTQSNTAARNTVPGTANDEPVTPELFTKPARREYIPDAKRVGDGAQATELAKARELFAAGDYHGARADAKRGLKNKEPGAHAKAAAADLLCAPSVGHMAVATVV